MNIVWLNIKVNRLLSLGSKPECWTISGTWVPSSLIGLTVYLSLDRIVDRSYVFCSFRCWLCRPCSHALIVSNYGILGLLPRRCPGYVSNMISFSRLQYFLTICQKYDSFLFWRSPINFFQLLLSPVPIQGKTRQTVIIIVTKIRLWFNAVRLPFDAIRRPFDWDSTSNRSRIKVEPYS